MLRLVGPGVVVVITCITLVSGQQLIPFPGAARLSYVSANLNYVWGVYQQKIYMCPRPCTGKNWKLIPGALVQVDVDDSEVWGVNAGNQIFKRPVDGTGGWQHIGGALIHVSASGNGYIWGVNKANHIYRCKKPCTGKWIDVDGRLKQIDGGQRAVYGVNSANDIYTRPVDGSTPWRHIPRKMKQVSASGTFDLYGVSPDDRIYRCRKPCNGEWEEYDRLARLSQCDATPNALFGVTSADTVWRQDLPL